MSARLALHTHQCDMNAFVPPSRHHCLRPRWLALSVIDTSSQAGMLKKHLRQQHQVLCLPEDVFPTTCEIHLKVEIHMSDTANISSPHSMHLKITSISVLCHAFDAAQATVQPIVAREELRMHIRHRSFMGLMLDQALCSELAARCAFCNLQVHARAMIRHYTDSHPELVGPAKQQYDFVSGLSNLVSGKGQCPMCQCKSLDLQKHTCAVIYQLAAMSGHVMSPDHFPIMPLRSRPWSATVTSGPEHFNPRAAH